MKDDDEPLSEQMKTIVNFKDYKLRGPKYVAKYSNEIIQLFYVLMGLALILGIVAFFQYLSCQNTDPLKTFMQCIRHELPATKGFKKR